MRNLLYTGSLERTKQRGQKRKLKNLIKNIAEIEPYQDTHSAYEHYHVPCGRFISSSKTNGKIKTAFCRAWLEKTAEIINNKPSNLNFCKIVALIDETDLWDSQIIIFYNKEYYDGFFSRNDEYQKWTIVNDPNKSLVKTRNIKTELKEVCYLETILDEDYDGNSFYRKSKLWFYGEI